ncbi:MAG TPA: hypothetical protein PKI20_13985 [Verrucomicrobiota bacterium]|nr:hypothetical protein [Verrucomicrobiota bacterium]HQL78810.1 hypothetical protein [Verrucomicrobiota bacterium]
MKRTLLALAAFVGIALSAHATSVFSDNFNSYADGAIDTVAAPTWFWHSGNTNQLQVASGQVLLGGANTEDVSAYITNSAFPNPFPNGPGNGSLYASFTINMSATTLPTGGGTYFFHFKDLGTMNYRARTWASNTGAAAGKFRLGISAAGNNPVYIATDFDPGTTYTVVVKWNLEQTNATVWVNPVSESSMLNRADSADTSNPSSFNAYCVSLRENNAYTGAGLITFDDLKVGTTFADVYTPSGPPSVGGIADQSIPKNGNTGPIAFTVDSPIYAPSTLVLSGTSDNTTLVPNNPANISFGGSDQNRTVTVTPATGQQGQATISVVATDPGAQTGSTTFQVKVGAPGFAAGIANQLTATNTPTAALPFTLTDAEGDTLTVTATSSNPTLVQDTDIVVSPASSTSTSRTVKITPQPDKAGITTITLTVSDGFTSATTSFTLNVYQQLGELLLGDTFTYDDGEINAVSGGFWQAHSAALSNDCVVVNNQLRVATTNYEDVNGTFTNSVYLVATGDSSPPYAFAGVILYSRFTVNFEVLPSGSGGGYFAHYKDLGTSNFRARIFAQTNGAAAGTFRLGIANGGNSASAVVPQDLSLGTTYTVYTRYNVSTAESTLWVNPNSEASGGVTATDLTTPVEIDKYCFRQTSGIGVVLVDDLLIGSAWSDVFTAPALSATTISTGSGNWDSSSSTLSYAGGNGSQFVLLESASPTAPMSSWTRVATNSATPGSFTIPAVGTAAPKFYRVASE